jgi:hypothetical protein
MTRRKIMKAYFKSICPGFSGRVDGLIFYRDPHCTQTLVRRQFAFKNHPGQAPFRAAQINIYALNPSALYRSQLSQYARLYDAQSQQGDRGLRSWTNAYNKMMWAMHKSRGVDLATLSREDIPFLPCRTVKDAITAELLPVVRGYQKFTAPF